MNNTFGLVKKRGRGRTPYISDAYLWLILTKCVVIGKTEKELEEVIGFALRLVPFVPPTILGWIRETPLPTLYSDGAVKREYCGSSIRYLRASGSMPPRSDHFSIHYGILNCRAIPECHMMTNDRKCCSIWLMFHPLFCQRMNFSAFVVAQP